MCIDWRQIPELLAASGEAYTELKNLCIWAKDNADMGSLCRSQHELVFVFKAGRGAHRTTSSYAATAATGATSGPTRAPTPSRAGARRRAARSWRCTRR